MAPPILRKLRLSDASVKRLSTGRSWDTEIGGFGVKVYPSGKAQFILRYRSRDKRQREFRIGQVGVIEVDEARRKARVLLGKISEGRDPAWERKLQLTEARLFNDVIDRYLSWASDHHKSSSFQEVGRFCRLHIRPQFGGFLVADLTRGRVQQTYDKLRQAPHFRAKIITWSRTIWAWGEKRELVGEGRNPFAIEMRVSRPRRDRVLSTDEYRCLWEAIERHRYRGAIRNVSLWAIEFLLLCPMRKSEAFQLKWEHIDLTAQIIRLIQHKTDRRDGPLEVYISPPLGALLLRIPRCCEWLFPAPDSSSGHIRCVDSAWRLIRREANLHKGEKRVTLHDLRRSWNSVGANLGYGPEFMGKVIGNSAKVNNLHYWHPTTDLKCEITRRVAEVIAGYSRPQQDRTD
ncbi:integrase arm-type DNA-binding domain-containing protein [Microvirga pakistanensis]|uniref:tyrosine-type recombinase/integrase n=1 Tax=Microvirga pakistanensis TaxID=1682650 RepID=UPI00106CC7F5